MNALAMASWRFYLRQPWQLLLCLLGIALGVAVVVAMDLAIDSARRGFALSNDAVFGATTHSLDAGPEGFDEQLYLRLRTELRRIPSAPVVSGEVLYSQGDGDEVALELLGIDPFAEAAFRNYNATAQGLASAGDVHVRLLSEPGTVLATQETLRRLGVNNGAWIDLRVAGRLRRAHIVGVVKPHNKLQRLGLENVLVADIAGAQELLDFNGRLSRVDLILAGPGNQRRDEAALKVLLPEGVRLRSREARNQAMSQLTRSFYLNLRMLSLLALVVGLFIVYNAMTFSVVRRREWIGYLRAVGVTARGILVMVLLEALVLGIAGTALGAPLGAGLAQVLLQLVTRSLDDLYFSNHVSQLDLSAQSLPTVLLVGIAGSLAAALAPALEATRITPRAAMLRSGLEQRVSRLGARLARVGVVLLLFIPIVLWWQSRNLSAGYAALFLAVIGFSCLTPAAISVFSAGLRSALRSRGAHLMRIALGGVHQGLSRNATAVTALMIALAASVGVGVMVDSFRQTLSAWLTTTLQADIYIAVDSRRHTDVIDPALVRAIAAIPGIASVTTSRDIEVITDQGDVWLKALDARAPRPFRGIAFNAMETRQAWRALAGTQAVIISEAFAWRHRLAANDSLRINTPVGPRRFNIVAVFRDYGATRGMIIMDDAGFREHWRDRAITDIGLYLAVDQPLQPVLDKVRQLAVGGQGLKVFANSAIRELSMEIFDQTFVVTRVLKWLAILVAVAGILSALTALQLEQRRQVAVLRAQGLTRGELFVIQELQTGCLGLLAGLLALPLGLILAGLLVRVINQRAFGWSLEFHLAPEIFIQSLLIAVGAALIAGLYPAWKLAHQSPAAAMRGL